MKRTILTALIVCLLSVHAMAQTRADEIMRQLSDPASEKILVVSHRGDWRNAPENSLQAIQNCIDMGVDMVEIDLKKTKDGELVLMHDKKIDRTTTGKGFPADYTLAELKQLRLRNGAGHKTAHTIPTLEEVMLLAKGKILVNIDKGYDYFDEVYEVLQRTGTLGQCVIKSDKPYGEVMAEKPVALEKMIFMPVVKLSKDNAADIIAEYEQKYHPLLYELVFDNDSDATMQLMALAKNSGAKLFVNSLWPELCGAHHDDRAVEQADADGSWGWLVNNGASVIQTDRPAALLRYLSDKNLR